MPDEIPQAAAPDIYRRFFDLSPDLLCVVGLDGYFRRVNPALEHALGYTEAELLARPFIEVVHPEDRSKVISEMGRLTTGTPVTNFEGRTLCKGGTYRWLVWSAQPSTEFGLVYAVGHDITEHKRDEDRSRQSEGKYRALFDSIDQGFAIVEMIFDKADEPVDFRLIEVNPQFEHLTGSPASEAIGKTGRQLMPEIEPKWLQMYGRVALTGEPVHFEEYSEALGRWYEGCLFPIETTAKCQVAVLYNDITERKRRETYLAFLTEIQNDFARLTSAEEIMQTVGAKLGSFLNISFSFFVDVDAERDEAQVHYLWNTEDVPKMPKLIRLSDVVTAEFNSASPFKETIIVNDTDTDPCLNSETCRAMKMRSVIGVPFHRDGKWKFALAIADSCPRDWREDEIQLLGELANRVFPRLERARAEAALRESEERLQKAVSIETVGVLFFNLDGRITSANRAFERMSGYSHEELLNIVHWEALTPSEFTDVTTRAAEELATRGETAPYEKQLIRKDGSRWWGLFAPTRLSGGSDFECVEFVLDITESRQAAEGRERARQEAEQAVRTRDEFLSIASHELRNPIASIKATSQLMMLAIGRGYLDEARAKRYARTIGDASEHLSLLVDDLLDVSRLQSGQLPLHKQPVDLSVVIRDAIEVQHIATQHHRFHLHIEDGHTLTLDPERIRQVVVNLLDNAIKYSPEGGEIYIQLSYDADGAILSIQDQGIGLSKGVLESIFEPFGRASNAVRSNIQGMGLGLYICRRIAKAHGGRLWAESEGEGRGATMYLRLPLMDGGK